MIKCFCGLGLLATLVLLTGVGQAKADTLFDISFSGSNINGQGTLDATANGNGSYTVVSGSVTVTDTNVALTNDLFTVYAAPNPGRNTSPDGSFYYDNLLFSSQPYLDSTDGLLFTDASGNEMNIWGPGYNNDPLYSAWISTPGQWWASQNNDVVFNATDPVTEPATLLLLGSGLVGLAVLRKRSNALSIFGKRVMITGQATTGEVEKSVEIFKAAPSLRTLRTARN
jgi:hypothetical protein